MSIENKLYIVKKSRIQGKGLFASQDIRKGRKIMEYMGEHLTLEKGMERMDEQVNSGIVGLFFVEPEDDPAKKGFYIDGLVNGNESVYINHSCDPNCEVDIVNGKVLVKSARKIKGGEELTYDYCFDADVGINFPCNCGAKSCRSFIFDAEQTGEFGKIFSREWAIYVELENSLRDKLKRQVNVYKINKNMIKMNENSIITALVETDEACFTDLRYNAKEFMEETQRPSFYGMIVYGWSSGDQKNIHAYIMTHNDSEKEGSTARTKGNGAYLVSCAVHPQLQKQRVFKIMLKSLSDVLKERKKEYIRLHTRTAENPRNNGAHNAFLRVGFEITRIIKNYYGINDDAYEMVKQLQ